MRQKARQSHQRRALHATLLTNHAYTRLQFLRAVRYSVGSDGLLNADNQSESEDDDTDAVRTVLYDVLDESGAIEHPTAAADAGECCDVSCGAAQRTRRAGAMRESAFLHILR